MPRSNKKHFYLYNFLANSKIARIFWPAKPLAETPQKDKALNIDLIIDKRSNLSKITNIIAGYAVLEDINAEYAVLKDINAAKKTLQATRKPKKALKAVSKPDKSLEISHDSTTDWDRRQVYYDNESRTPMRQPVNNEPYPVSRYCVISIQLDRTRSSTSSNSAGSGNEEPDSSIPSGLNARR